MSAKLGAGRLLRAAHRRFRLWGSVLVFFFPGGVVCVLAGASGMPVWLFLILNVGGTLLTIVLLRSAGEEVSGLFDYVLDFMDEHMVPLTILSAVVTLAVLVRHHRSRS